MNIEQRLTVKSSIELIGDDLNEVSRLFFRELFHSDINFKKIFHGDVAFLNRKFANMMATFKDLKYLEKIRDSIEKMGKRHILNYGVQIEHFVAARQALMKALSEYLGHQFTPEMERAWEYVFSEVEEIMKAAMSNVDRRKVKRKLADDSDFDADLLSDIGGESVVVKVHQHFYDIMFDHPWLGQFFFGKSKEALILKQTKFMVGAFGGTNDHTFDTPAFIHMHMFITDEIADLRQEILKQSILSQGLSSDIAKRWLKVDDSFRESIVKKSVEECIMKCVGQVPIVAKKPIYFRSS